MEYWDAVIAQVRSSPFLLGNNDRGWVANYDFVVERAEKIMDGKYSAGMVPKGAVGAVSWLKGRREDETAR